MIYALRWSLVLGGACLLALTTAAAEPQAGSTKVPPVKAGGRSPDLWKSLSGAIFVIGEDVRDALHKPGAIILTPEEWKKVQDQIDQFKRLVSAEKPITPTRCKLNGQVESTAAGDIVRFEAEFTFETEAPRTRVVLGCGNAWPTAVKLDDGKLPEIAPPGEDGYIVRVETPGAHKLHMTLELPVTVRGSDRSFELLLPEAVITILESLDLPGSVRDKVKVTGLRDKAVRFPAVQLSSEELHSRKKDRQSLALGAIDLLEISWKGPVLKPPGEALLAAEGQVQVQVDEASVTIKAELTLSVVRGQNAVWRVLAPANASLDLRGYTAEEGFNPIIPPKDPQKPEWTIRLKEPTAEPLTLEIRYRQPRAAKRVAVGPFTVLGAVRQRGTITITAPPEVRAVPRPQGDLSRREIPEEMKQDTNAVASFTYFSLPQPSKDKPVPVPLELEIETVKGVIESRVKHTLSLTMDGWHISSEFQVWPIRTAVDRLEVALPAGYQDARALPPELVEPLELKAPAGEPPSVGLIKLVREQRQPPSQPSYSFRITLEKLVRLVPGADRITLELPRPLGTLDSGGEVLVEVPAGLELTAPQTGSTTAWAGPRTLTWRSEVAPNQVELSWRRHRPDLPVNGEIDLTLEEKQVRVSQTLYYPADHRGSFVLRGPAGLARDVTVVDGKLDVRDVPTTWEVTRTGASRDNTVTLHYWFPLPEASPDKLPAAPERGKSEGSRRRFVVPLIWPDQATRGSTKIRVWCAPGVRPTLAAGPWEELPTELVPQRDSLPALVLRGSSLEENHAAPLSLTATEAGASPLAAVVVDRVLVQVVVGDGGQQTYRTRFLLSKVSARFLDVELPAPPASLNLDVRLNGLKLAATQVVDDAGRENANGRILRLPIQPELYLSQVAWLDVDYQLGPPSEPRVGWANWRVQTALTPPRLRGPVFLGRVRWLLTLPGDWTPLTAGSNVAFEQRWSLRGWLLAPGPAATAADLERWLTSQDAPVAEPVDRGGTVSLVCWQSTLQPLRLTQVPQQWWLLGCSLAVVVVGLSLYYLPLGRGAFWGAIATLGVAVVVVGILWPSVMPAFVYGAQPGVLVLALVLGVQWFLHRRYRRQVVFMPGFTRLKAGSSLVRTGSSHRPRTEPSTIDAPQTGSLS